MSWTHDGPASARISLDLLRGFEAAARHLNFTRAATELFVTQSAVSRQVKTLEEQLNRKLFVRANGRLSLTEAGLSLHQAVMQAQDVLGAAVEHLRPQPRGAALVVAAAEPFATLTLAPALGGMRGLEALRELRVVASNDPEEQARLRPHVTIRHYRPGSAPRGSVELAPDRVAPACSPQFLREAGSSLREPADLARFALLRYEAVVERRTRVDWARWLAAHGLAGLRPRTWVHFNRYDQAITAAVAGAGVMLARVSLMERLLAQGLLVLPWKTRVLHTGAWHATIDPDLRDRAPAEAFIRELSARIGAD